MPSPRLCLLAACLLTACPDSTTPPTTMSETDPTTGTATTVTTGPEVPTTTIDPSATDTSGSTGSTSTGATEDTSTTIDPTTGEAVDCVSIDDEITCLNTEACKWSGVVGYTYSAQGCQGSISSFCIDAKVSGGATAWYRDLKDTQQVVEFGYTPQNLADEWKQCDCDGPLACLCSSVTEACPERLDEFCAVNITKNGCENASIKAEPQCGWFQIAPEGPIDDACEVKQKYDKCLPATDGGPSKACKAEDKITLDYVDKCNGAQDVDPPYWRDNNGVLEVIQTCGPTPIGWTACEPMDTPDQPDECKCVCL